MFYSNVRLGATDFYVHSPAKWVSLIMGGLSGSISISGLFAGLLFGLIGMWMFRQGKKNLNHPVLIIGICLMAYPYFTTSPVADWGLGVLLCGLAYYLW